MTHGGGRDVAWLLVYLTRALSVTVCQFRIPKQYLVECGWILTKLFLFDKTYTSYRQGHLRGAAHRQAAGAPDKVSKQGSLGEL